MPAGMESCRKPAVLEKTSTLVSGAADAAGAHAQEETRATAAARTAVKRRGRLRIAEAPYCWSPDGGAGGFRRGRSRRGMGVRARPRGGGDGPAGVVQLLMRSN